MHTGRDREVGRTTKLFAAVAHIATLRDDIYTILNIINTSPSWRKCSTRSVSQLLGKAGRVRGWGSRLNFLVIDVAEVAVNHKFITTKYTGYYGSFVFCIAMMIYLTKIRVILYSFRGADWWDTDRAIHVHQGTAMATYFMLYLYTVARVDASEEALAVTDAVMIHVDLIEA